ncbi:MAG: hypothetical protein ACYC27_02180 [Armatimonadota bacterium]
MRFIISIVFTAILIQSVVTAAPVKLSGVIGDTDLTFTAYEINTSGSRTYKINKGTHILRVKEVYPDTPAQPVYKYNVKVGSSLIYKREHTGTGFGIVSSFVYLPDWASKSTAVTIINTGSDKVRIIGVETVDPKRLSGIMNKDSFGLFGLVTPYQGAEVEHRWVKELASGIPEKKGFYRGFSTEYPYASWPKDVLSSQIKRHLSLAKEHNLAYFPSFVSWWASTPGNIADGEGGKFGDIKYQQICWSPDDNADEGPAFRQLLGDRWNIHYGLSIPNEWSDTPWLTMNSPVLNEYRYKSLEWIMNEFADQMKSADVKISGIYLENEPRYWDTACEAGNPKRDWNITWADFNPLVIADALKDGVNIDPSNGLGYEERMWLHRNVARYNQGIVDSANNTLEANKLTLGIDIYTHSLQLIGFPGDEIGHAMSEWAYANGAYTGLEGIWCKLADFDRVREWGPWANLNREEGDGRDIKEHLWDLRVTYARGGRLYNSYNWNNVGAERVFNYMKEFLDNLPSVKVNDPDIRQENTKTISFKTSPDVQGANRIKIRINISDPKIKYLYADVKNSIGRTIGYAQANGHYKIGIQNVEFMFSDPFELMIDERGTLNVSSTNGKGHTLADASKIEFWFDLKRERAQNLLITEYSKH